MRQSERAIAEPVVVAVDRPARELLFEMHRQPMRQGALAEIPFEQESFARVEFMKPGNHSVQLGLHVASGEGER